MTELGWPAKLAVWVIPVLFAITVHEVAHGYVARRLGDRTAQMMGRLTLNPLKHIDPVGTLLVPALLFFAGGFLMGWAKPVPVAIRNLRRPRRDMALVAIAGPGANLLMALGWAVVARLAVVYHHAVGGDSGSAPFFIVCAGVAGIVINVVLMLLNLLPIPPLDGGRVLAGVVPRRYAYWLDRFEPFGLALVVVLLVSGALAWVLGPAVGFAIAAILDLVQISPELFQAVHIIIRPRGGGA
jgi:Zn-dependent protease